MSVKLSRMIKKTGDKWSTVHCRVKDKGKVISSFNTRREALAQHRAIQASKSRLKRRVIRKRYNDHDYS
jgi:hypothetical protein